MTTLGSTAQKLSPKPIIPYRYDLDEVSIEHDSSKYSYKVVFRKIITNISDRPIKNFYARIMVCAYPDALYLADKHYWENPISLKKLKYRSWNAAGESLKTTVIHAEPYVIELLIWYESSRSGKTFHLMPGQTQEVFYEITPSEAIWGPFIMRHVRCDCEQLKVRLDFDVDLVQVKSEIMDHANCMVIDPPLARKLGDSKWWIKNDERFRQTTKGNRVSYTMDALNPAQQSFYRLSWMFNDARYEKLVKKTKASHKLEPPEKISVADCLERGLVSVLPDFRGLNWFGKWYSFTSKQAQCIELLWNAWAHNRPFLTSDYILTEAELDASKLSAVFRRSQAWEDGVIFSPAKGTYALKPPKNFENSL